jgi:predicted dehydrogenase
MINYKDTILIIGAGSIGERHIRNLLSLGYTNINVWRTRQLPLRTLSEQKVKVITREEDLDIIQPKVAFICTPTALHIEQAIACAKRGIHILIEKPLSDRLEGVDQLKFLARQNNIYVKIGYMMRFHPLMVQLKEMIGQKAYGPLLSFTTHWGEYLPDWHPWEDYRISYAARKELGGGAGLTLSHDIDMVNWLTADTVEKFHALKNYVSSLEVDVEAGIDFLIKYRNGVTGHIHLNFFEKPANRFMLFVFEEGSVCFNYYKAVLKINTKQGAKEIRADNFDRNQLFMDQARTFFSELATFTVQDSIRNIEESELIIKMCI